MNALSIDNCSSYFSASPSRDHVRSSQKYFAPLVSRLDLTAHIGVPGEPV